MKLSTLIVLSLTVIFVLAQEAATVVEESIDEEMVEEVMPIADDGKDSKAIIEEEVDGPDIDDEQPETEKDV